jgi:hypothetical protein
MLYVHVNSVGSCNVRQYLVEAYADWFINKRDGSDTADIKKYSKAYPSQCTLCILWCHYY